MRRQVLLQCQADLHFFFFILFFKGDCELTMCICLVKWRKMIVDNVLYSIDANNEFFFFCILFVGSSALYCVFCVQHQIFRSGGKCIQSLIEMY